LRILAKEKIEIKQKLFNLPNLHKYTTVSIALFTIMGEVFYPSKYLYSSTLLMSDSGQKNMTIFVQFYLCVISEFSSKNSISFI